MRTLSKNTSVVEWFIMVRIGRMVSPAFLASRISRMKTESPSMRLLSSLDALRDRLDRGGVGATRRLGHPEGLQAQRAGGDLRQIFALLRGVAVPEQRA